VTAISLTVSEANDVRLPAEVLQEMGFHPGDELCAIIINGRLQVFRPLGVENARGCLAGYPGLSSLDPELRDRSDEIQ
jgi:hypothetical protein